MNEYNFTLLKMTDSISIGLRRLSWLVREHTSEAGDEGGDWIHEKTWAIDLQTGQKWIRYENEQRDDFQESFEEQFLTAKFKEGDKIRIVVDG